LVYRLFYLDYIGASRTQGKFQHTQDFLDLDHSNEDNKFTSLEPYYLDASPSAIAGYTQATVQVLRNSVLYYFILTHFFFLICSAHIF
jgi:hypothetical protein